MAGQRPNLRLVAGGRQPQPPLPFSKDRMVASLLKLYPEADLTLEWKEKYGGNGYMDGATYRTVTLSDASVYCYESSFDSLEDAYKSLLKRLQQKTGDDLFQRLARIERALR